MSCKYNNFYNNIIKFQNSEQLANITFSFLGSAVNGIAIRTTGANTDIQDLQNLRTRSTGLNTEIQDQYIRDTGYSEPGVQG